MKMRNLGRTKLKASSYFLGTMMFEPAGTDIGVSKVNDAPQLLLQTSQRHRTLSDRTAN